MADMKLDETKATLLSWLTVGGALVVGAGSMLLALIALVDTTRLGGPGHYLLVAAIAFGLLANAVLRD